MQVWDLGYNVTLNNISVISWRSVLLVEETGVSGENHRPIVNSLTNFITYCCIEYTSPERPRLSLICCYYHNTMFLYRNIQFKLYNFAEYWIIQTIHVNLPVLSLLLWFAVPCCKIPEIYLTKLDIFILDFRNISLKPTP